MASKKVKVSEEETTKAAQVEEQDSTFRSYEQVRPLLTANEAAGSKERWSSPVPYASRRIEALAGEISVDAGAILKRLEPIEERPELEARLERIGALARSARYVFGEVSGQLADRKALSADEYKRCLAQAKEDRRVLLLQAPLLVNMDLLSAERLGLIRAGVGPLDTAADVEALVGVFEPSFTKLADLQDKLYAKPADRLSPARLKDAAANAGKLGQHVGRTLSELRPDAKRIDWSAQLKANLYLLRTDWEAICSAARYHYERSGQPALIKQRVVPLGAMRQR